MFDHSSGKTISVAGAAIYYEETGNKQGAPILLLHGGFGTLEDFNPLLPFLEKEYRLIALDARGQGKSTTGNAGLSYARMQMDAEELLNELQIKEIIIIGFSDGGMVANRMAVTSSVTVKKMILIGTPWTMTDLEESEEILSRIDAESWKEKFPGSYALYKRLNPAVDFTSLSNDLKTMWLDDSNDGGYPGSQVKQIACPVLMIRGADDHLVSNASALDYVATVPKGNFVSIPASGHEAHKDDPETTGNAILQFLRSTA